MDLSHLPTDYFAKSTQFTKDLHYDVYPSIDPTTEPLSQKCKVVMITGASSGIGRHGIAMSFAKAKARTIIIVGRNKNELESTATELIQIAPKLVVDIRVIDISSETEVKNAFLALKTKYPRIDILVNNAGSGDFPLPITEVEAKGWWSNFETMVKGTFLMTQQFLHLNGKDADVTIINVTSAAAFTSTPCLSSYSLSKLCTVQLQKFVLAENPKVRAVSMHPGIVITKMTPPAFHRFARDTFTLVGGAAVWLSSPQADFMNGRYFSVNWSVDELLERKEEIVSEGLLQVALQGKFGNF